MNSASEHLRSLAGIVVDKTVEFVPVRAALLAGSAGRGDADHFSDIDLIVYVDQIPTQDASAKVREAVGGTDPLRKGQPTENFSAEEFDLKGVRVELAFATVGWMELRLDELLDRLVDFDSPSQKILAGLLEGVPLYGRELIKRWNARVGRYPEALRLATVQRYWRFFPLWYEGAALANRDAELWRLDMLLEGAFNLLGVLAGLNRLYFTRFQFKRMREFVAGMKLAPDRLADRLESLFRLDAEGAAAELERLVEETLTLVETELPDFDTGMRFPPGTRHQPWTI